MRTTKIKVTNLTPILFNADETAYIQDCFNYRYKTSTPQAEITVACLDGTEQVVSIPVILEFNAAGEFRFANPDAFHAATALARRRPDLFRKHSA